MLAERGALLLKMGRRAAAAADFRASAALHPSDLTLRRELACVIAHCEEWEGGVSGGVSEAVIDHSRERAKMHGDQRGHARPRELAAAMVVD